MMVKILLVIVMMVTALNGYADNEEEIRLVTFKTNYGDIELEIYLQAAPNLTKHFLDLCSEQFYTGTYFHYVDIDFIIAGGDPNTKDGDRKTDGRSAQGSMKDEISARALGLDTLLVGKSYLAQHLPRNSPAQKWTMQGFLESQGYKFNNSLPSIPNEYGVISMAANQPNTNGSQFFIVTAKDGASWLNGKNTVIGRVKTGMDVVHKIENLPADDNFNPLEEHQAIIEKTIVD